MARIIVTTEQAIGSEVLLDERVGPEHLNTEHSAAQLIERLRWAVHDAESAQRAHGGAAEQSGASQASQAQPRRRA